MESLKKRRAQAEAEKRRKERIEAAKKRKRTQRNIRRGVRTVGKIGKATIKGAVITTKFVIANFTVILTIASVVMASFIIAAGVVTIAGGFFSLFQPDMLKTSSGYKGTTGTVGSGLPLLDEGSRFYLPVERNTVTSLFGNRERPTEGASTNHKGIDVGSGGSQDPITIYPARPGRVIKAYTYDVQPVRVQDKRSSDPKAISSGQYVEVEHSVKGKRMVTRYLHMYRVQVSVGQEVGMNTPLGIVGNTGTSTGAHLHFEIVNTAGVKIDPAKMLYCGDTPIKVGLHASECFKYRMD